MESLLREVLEKPPGERSAFLEAAYRARPDLRATVEARLKVSESSAAWLQGPLVDPCQTVDSDVPVVPVAPADVTGEFTPTPLGDVDLGSTVATIRSPIGSGSFLGGRYRLEEMIGEGGMGEVWVAFQTQPVKRKVALKLIKPGMDSRAVLQRFEQERQALAMMDHPNIAKVLDAGLTPTGQPFFVMELVNGLSLTRFCDENKLTPTERLELFVPICQAVQHAHQKGVVHRDLKPANILVSMVDGKPTPKVIDFGLAKATTGELTADSPATQFGSVVGTLEYMSPEQAGFSSEDIDTRSDIYSLGIILYELLTGLRPIDAGRLRKAAVSEMIRIIREEEPSKPSARLSTNESLPSLAALRRTEPRRLMTILRGELDWVVMKCLEKQRDRRYESAGGLARDVQRYLADEPVEARPPSAGYRAAKFLRRHKGPAVAASLVLLALIVGIVGTSWGMWKANRSAEAEHLAKLEAQLKRAEAEKAVAAEKAANELTRKRLTQIEKGMELFARMLTSSNPKAEEQGGEPLYVQLRRQAEQAAEELDADAVGDPLTVARLQNVLGDTLRGLGGVAKAREVLEKARATRERELGPDHADTLMTLNNIALIDQAEGKLPEAIPVFERVVAGMTKSLGPEHTETQIALQNLGNAYRSVGKYPEAIAILERLRDTRVRTLGPDDPKTLKALHTLALAYAPAGRSSEAITMMEQVRDGLTKTVGADHADTLLALNNLANIYQSAGRRPEAIAILERVRDGYLRTVGAEHPFTILVLNNLAGAYQSSGKLDQAIPLYEMASTGIAKTRFRHEYAGRIIPNTISAYERAGRFDKEEEWLRRWLPVVEQRSGADSPACASELASLGLSLLRQKKWAEAEPILRRCLSIRETKEPGDWRTFNTKSMLGAAFLGREAYAEAEPLLLAGYQGMKARESAIPPQASARVTEALDRLIALYTAMNKPDELKKWTAVKSGPPAAKP